MPRSSDLPSTQVPANDDAGGDLPELALSATQEGALAAAERTGLVDIIDWSTYDDNSHADNPCLRDKMGNTPRCMGRWGWAMARYRQPGGVCDGEGRKGDAAGRGNGARRARGAAGGRRGAGTGAAARPI